MAVEGSMHQHGASSDILSAFGAAPGIGVGVLDPSGNILFANEYGAALYGGGSAAEHVGKNLLDLFPREWAEERIRLLKRVSRTGERLLMRYIWRGKQVEVQHHPIADDEHGPRILVIAREGRTVDGDVPEGFSIVPVDTVELGPLEVLTARELEVLALIGQGRSAKEIGEVLGCSHRTVERHRDAIGKKLQKRDRVELALVAQQAGLELRDAHLKRVHMEPRSEARPDTKPASEAEAKPDPEGKPTGR